MGKTSKVRTKQFCDTSNFEKFYVKAKTLKKKITISDLENQFDNLTLPKDWFVVNDSIRKVGKKYIVELSDKPKGKEIWESQETKMLLVVTKHGYVVLICKRCFRVDFQGCITAIGDIYSKTKLIKVEQNLVVNEV